MEGFETRRLGRTSLRVTVLGLGCATIGGHRIPVTAKTAKAVVRAAWAAGLRYFDTAPFYGFGQSERSVGDALRLEPRDEWVLSTKAGRLLRTHTRSATPGHQHPMPFDLVFDYTYDGIMRSFEDSLQRLGLARIDILWAHDLGTRQHGPDAHPEILRTFRAGGFRALEELRRSGVVKAIGIGVNEREVLLEAMEWGAWDAFLLAGRYTLLEQQGLDDLFPKCLRSGISIVIGAPHNTGILAGRDSWNYRPAPREILDRVNAIRAVCDAHGVPVVAAALQFPLAHPAVAAVLPGPATVEEIEADARLLRDPIPPPLWADLRTAGLLHPDAPTPA